jgi:stage II sporulation protein AA (anti-sigma F factor antagonist)
MEKAADSYPMTVILDFGEVDFMDSTGIGTILARYKVLRDRNIELCVRNVNKQVDKLFRLTGIYSILNLVR